MSNWLTERFDGQQVERPQGADLVDAAGESAAAQHQRGARRAALAARRGVHLDDVAHLRLSVRCAATSIPPPGFVRSNARAPPHRSSSPCSPSRSRPTAQAAGLAATQRAPAARDGPRGRRPPAPTWSISAPARSSTPPRPTSAACPPRSRSSTRPRARCCATARDGRLTTSVLSDGAAGRDRHDHRQRRPARRRRPDVQRPPRPTALAKQLAQRRPQARSTAA